MAGQDEQGVVDAHTQSQHEADDGGDLRHGDQARQDANDAAAGENRCKRSNDRQTGCHHGSEGDQQDDHCCGDRDHLAARLGCGVGVAERTVVLHLDAGVAHLLDCRLGVLELFDSDLLGVVADGHEGGRPVSAQCRRFAIVGIADADHVGAGCQAGDGPRDGRLGGTPFQAVRGVEDDGRGVERLLGEPVLEGIRRSLGLGTGNAELLGRRAAVGTVQQHHRRREDPPHRQHPPRVPSCEMTDDEKEA